MSLIEEEAWGLLGVWRDWKTFGALPGPGDSLDQEATIFDAIMICEQARADIEDKHRQDVEREQKKIKRDSENAARERRRR